MAFLQSENTWLALANQTSGLLVSNQLSKSAGDSVVLSIDFGNIPAIIAGATIASVSVSSSPSGLTIGAASINTLGYACQANFSGGSSGVTYVVAWSATLATGVVISRSCSLQVI